MNSDIDIYNRNTLRKKYPAFKDLEKGICNKVVAAKYNGVPKSTLSTWVKNKEKLLDSLEKGSNNKRQKMRTGNLETVDKAIFNWFLSMRSQNAISCHDSREGTYIRQIIKC